ncbi:MAG: tRNA lysidine(34) synthetase TilS, partial [Luteimonas sp.]|nr:tRNA lysidine(34) synthetase TilS [Luteimonas sp.]
AWRGDTPFALPGGGTLRFTGTPTARDDPASVAPPFVVHARVGGERIRLPGRRHGHALKHVLQDLGVPPWIRARLPLLSGTDGQLLAAGDLAFSADFDAWLRAGARRLAWDAA